MHSLMIHSSQQRSARRGANTAPSRPVPPRSGAVRKNWWRGGARRWRCEQWRCEAVARPKTHFAAPCYYVLKYLTDSSVTTSNILMKFFVLFLFIGKLIWLYCNAAAEHGSRMANGLNWNNHPSSSSFIHFLFLLLFYEKRSHVYTEKRERGKMVVEKD